MVGTDIGHTRRTWWNQPHASGRQQYCGRRQTVLYSTAWATRLGSIHTLSLTCKAIPFIYKRGCTLSQQRPRWTTTDDIRIIPTHFLLALDILKLHKAYVPIHSARRSSRHSRPFGLESDRTSNTPILLPLVCHPIANFEHLGSGIKSPADSNWMLGTLPEPV